ncbi:ankyrin repeat-containing domain protein [Trichoderma sp. SZMC 28015]
MSDPNNYTIGWISAIEIEYIAAQEFLEEEHDPPERVHQNDENHYTLGRIGKHNVVIVVLPRGDNGVAAAAMAAKDMMHSFPNVRVCLMVGIGGGAPSKRHDIRLGDVVVSVPTFSEKGGNQGGVIQYDYGRTIQEKCFQGARYLNRPPRSLLTAVTGLGAKYKRCGNNIDKTINDILQTNPRLREEYGRPDAGSDKLYSSDPVQILSAGKDLASELIERPKRSEKEDNPAVHYGLIASADGFMEDAQIRDILAEELDVLCFEMEAAGLMNSFPCLVIRGICDYSDRHWFKEWRGYAAMTAAAYAKALLEVVPASDVDKMQTIKDLVPPELFERARSFIAPFWSDKKKEVASVSEIADPEEIQTKDTSKDQPYQMPPTPAQSPIMGDVELKEISGKNRGKDQPYQKPPIRTTATRSPVMGDLDPEKTQAKGSGKDQPYQMSRNQTAKTAPAKDSFNSSQIEIKHVYIAVMGVTGAGKSSLISLCTGKNVKIGHNLESCTSDVEDVEFMLNDHVCVHLIDTPGFDDTSRSDVEVLQNIAVWLTDSLKLEDIKLSGIIYLHRIIDVRMAGSALRNLSMFKKLCGEGAYSSVVLATSMWSQVDEATGAQREQELIETKKFWGHMYEKGSRIFRLDQTRESCLEIIKYIISLGSTTLLELQDEIVNHHRQIEDTEAGVQLNQDIIRERQKHQAELLALKEQMQEEMAEHDAELQRALKEEYDELKENIRRSDEEQAKLKQDLKDVHERKERELLELKKQMWAERQRYDENRKRQAKEYDDKIRRSEERSRKQLEILERKNSEQNDRLRRTEEAHYKQKAALERQAKENADRVKAWAEHRNTPLHLAAMDGKADVAASLLFQGANIEAKNKYGRTPLYLAVLNGKADIAELLLDQEADIEAMEADGWTILHKMAAKGNADMVNFLLNHGAKLEAKINNNGNTPVGLAIWNNQLYMAKLLLKRGANINARRSTDGATILHQVATDGRVEWVDFLLCSGASLEVHTDKGLTPFGRAVWNEKADMAEMLLHRGANLEATDTENWTILHFTAANGKASMVKFLLDHGANLEAKTNKGDTPFGLALWNEKPEVAKLLLHRGANIEAQLSNLGDTQLHIVAHKGKIDMGKFLLDYGANIEAKRNDGNTPLYHAISNGKINMANLLLNRGANIDALQNEYGQTILHIMASEGKTDMVKFLLDHGADIKAETKSGNTPLSWAALEGKKDVVKLLVKRLRDRGARG